MSFEFGSNTVKLTVGVGCVYWVFRDYFDFMPRFSFAIDIDTVTDLVTWQSLGLVLLTLTAASLILYLMLRFFPLLFSSKRGNAAASSLHFSPFDVGSRAAVMSIKGHRQHMEDTYQAIPSLGERRHWSFYGVFDGHGGERCSAFTAQFLHRYIWKCLDSHIGIYAIHNFIRNTSADNQDFKGLMSDSSGEERTLVSDDESAALLRQRRAAAAMAVDNSVKKKPTASSSNEKRKRSYKDIPPYIQKMMKEALVEAHRDTDREFLKIANRQQWHDGTTSCSCLLLPAMDLIGLLTDPNSSLSQQQSTSNNNTSSASSSKKNGTSSDPSLSSSSTSSSSSSSVHSNSNTSSTEDTSAVKNNNSSASTSDSTTSSSSSTTGDGIKLASTLNNSENISNNSNNSSDSVSTKDDESGTNENINNNNNNNNSAAALSERLLMSDDNSTCEGGPGLDDKLELIDALEKSEENDTWLFVCNTGDSRCVLVTDDGRAIAMSVDHKPNRQDERERIESNGGRVVFFGTWRVEGILAVSRSLGDRHLKQWVIPDPDIVCRKVQNNDLLLVLASDGIWDVLSNGDVARLAYDTWNLPQNSMLSIKEKLMRVSAKLTTVAFRTGSMDNITTLVVHLNSHCTYQQSCGPSATNTNSTTTTSHHNVSSSTVGDSHG